MIKGEIHWNKIPNLNMYASNNRDSKTHKRGNGKTQGTETSTTINGDPVTFLLVTDRTNR